ncbi:MAG: PIN domain-containing protein [Ilumatobacteraceae bacterium]
MSDLRATVLDSDAFSLLFVRRDAADSRIAGWRELLAGRRVLISFQTRAELLAGAMFRGWGERRTIELRTILDRTPMIGVDDEVIDAHATLYAECRQRGHALHTKENTADRWVAACAMAKSAPLLAGDGIYQGAPGLSLLMEG